MAPWKSSDFERVREVEVGKITDHCDVSKDGRHTANWQLTVN